MAHKKALHKHAELGASSATLRDHFAAAALTALCHMTADEGIAEDVARRAYVMADAMLTARDVEVPEEGVKEG